MPLLKCIEGDKSNYVLAEIREGICGQHLNSRALAKKSLRAGYYWPIMIENANNFLKKCDMCQRHADVDVALPIGLISLSPSLPFARLGMDILGPFSTAPSHVKYLIVVVDYFTE